MNRVLSRDDVDSHTLDQIYLAVVQSVMIYGSETWVMTLRMGRVLGWFHLRVAHSLMGRKPWRIRDGILIYPSLEDVMAEAGLQEVDTYDSCRQNIVTQFIVTKMLWACDWWRTGGQVQG